MIAESEPQQLDVASGLVVGSAAAGWGPGTVSRRASVSWAWPAAQPQDPPAALVSQQAALSEGSQQVACASVEQQLLGALVVGERSVSSAMRSAPAARWGGRSSRPTGRGARSR